MSNHFCKRHAFHLNACLVTYNVPKAMMSQQDQSKFYQVFSMGLYASLAGDSTDQPLDVENGYHVEDTDLYSCISFWPKLFN